MTFKKYFLLKEDIKHNLIWVYHRTRIHPEQHDLVKGMFNKKGNVRASYGQGLYSTFNLDSQLEQKMKDMYGPYILRMKVNISNFFILDKDVFQILHPEKKFWKYVQDTGMKLSSLGLHDHYDLHDYFEEFPHKEPEFGSDIAKVKHEYLIKKGFSGIIFNGRTDGKVAVIWKPETLVINSYSHDDGKTWILVEQKNLKDPYVDADVRWKAYKKTGKIQELSLKQFEDMLYVALGKEDQQDYQYLLKFFKEERNHKNLIQKIKKDANTGQRIHQQLINALPIKDVWDFYRDCRDNVHFRHHIDLEAQFGNRLIDSITKNKVPHDLYVEIQKDLSRVKNTPIDRSILNYLKGDHSEFGGIV